MAFKPNYNQQRAERSRAKQQKKQEKLARKQDEPGKPGESAGDEPSVAEPSVAVDHPEQGGPVGS